MPAVSHKHTNTLVWFALRVHSDISKMALGTIFSRDEQDVVRFHCGAVAAAVQAECS